MYCGSYEYSIYYVCNWFMQPFRVFDHTVLPRIEPSIAFNHAATNLALHDAETSQDKLSINNIEFAV